MKQARTYWRDAGLPAVLVVLGAAELTLLGARGWAVAVGLEAMAGVLLVFRRRHALLVAPVLTALMLAIPALGPRLNEAAMPIPFIIVAVFSLARWIADLRGVAGLVVIVSVFLLNYAFVDPRDHNVTDVVFVLSLAVPPYVFGRIVRRLEDQQRQLTEQQALISDQAVAAERERIARELHDVLAHSLSAMVVQTAAAQDLLGSSPDRAAALLQSVADIGRQALEETGRLLHLIRDDADELGLRPAPGLRDVPALVDTFRAHGLPLEVSIDLADRALPVGVDVSAYRVVQELLTNALRYAAGPVQLLVAAEPDRLRISCANATARSRAGAGSGLGLQGIAERVALLDGTLDRTDEGGRFAVAVHIPLVAEVAQ